MSDLSKFPCRIRKFSQDETTATGNLQKVEIVVMHEGANGNNTDFSRESIDYAESTLKNIPILAYIERDSNGEAIDFDEHNVVTTITMGDDGYEVKRFFKEQPIGVIPETNNYRIEEIDGVDHVVVDGYIWRCYSNEGIDLIEETNSKGVSMEIAVEEGKKNKTTGLYEISKYSYLGVTVLGDHVPPAMGDTCKLTAQYSKNEELQFALQELNKEVMEVLQVEDEVKDPVVPVEGEESAESVLTEPVSEEPSTQEPEGEEEVQEGEGASEQSNGEEPIPQNYSLSLDNISAMMRKTMSEMKVTKTDYWGEMYETQNYYLQTIVPSESVAIVNDNTDYYSYYGVPYAMDGDHVVLDFDNKKEYIQTWREKKSGEVIATFSEKKDELKDVVMKKFSLVEEEKKSLAEEVKTLKAELEELRTFKLEKEKEALAEKVESTVAKFSELTEDEVKEAKEKALTQEISVEDMEMRLFALIGIKKKAEDEIEAGSYSKKGEKETARVTVPSHTFSEEYKPYGDLFDIIK